MTWFGAGVFFIGMSLLLAYLLFGRESEKNMHKQKKHAGNQSVTKQKKDGEYIKLLKKYLNKGKIDEIELIIDRLEALSEENRREVRDFLKENGFQERLAALLADRDYRVRVRAVGRLALIGGPGTAEVVFEAMADKNEEVRMAAAEAIRVLNDPSIIPDLINALKQPNKWLPARIAETLLYFGSQAIPAMIKALEKEEPIVRAYLIEILGEIDDPGILFPLAACLKDSDSQVRLQALRALGKSGEKGTEEILIRALEDPEPKVQIQALRSLVSKGSPAAAGTVGKKLASSEPKVRIAAFDLLRNMGSEGLEIIRQTAAAQEHPMASKASDYLKSSSGK